MCSIAASACAFLSIYRAYRSGFSVANFSIRFRLSAALSTSRTSGALSAKNSRFFRARRSHGGLPMTASKPGVVRGGRSDGPFEIGGTLARAVADGGLLGVVGSGASFVLKISGKVMSQRMARGWTLVSSTRELPQ